MGRPNNAHRILSAEGYRRTRCFHPPHSTIHYRGMPHCPTPFLTQLKRLLGVRCCVHVNHSRTKSPCCAIRVADRLRLLVHPLFPILGYIQSATSITKGHSAAHQLLCVLWFRSSIPNHCCGVPWPFLSCVPLPCGRYELWGFVAPSKPEPCQSNNHYRSKITASNIIANMSSQLICCHN